MHNSGYDAQMDRLRQMPRRAPASELEDSVGHWVEIVDSDTREAIVLRDAHLDAAVRRAVKWIRNTWVPNKTTPPRHIRIALAALKGTDERRYLQLLQERVERLKGGKTT